MSALALLLYIFTFGFVLIYATTNLRLKEVRFEDGIFIGLLFFIVTPVSISFIDGNIASIDMLAGPYRPFDDYQTSFQICIGCFTIVAFHRLAYRLMPKQNIYRIAKREYHGSIYVISMFLIAYMACNIYSFLSSGKLAGGHWQENLETGLQNSVLLIVIGNFANVYRGAVFGIIYNSYEKALIGKGAVLLIGLFVVIFDIFTTFNRITAAYYAIVIILMNRRHLPVLAALGIPALPVVGYLSIVWSSMRGLALVNGYSLSGFLDAMNQVNVAIDSGAMQIGSSLNGIFDSENIIVFDWLVKNTGERFPILYGYTFLLRPLTVLIPSTMWGDKPGVFGIMVGSNLQGIPGLALNSTLFGEAFGNFYFFWPIILLLTLLLVTFVYGRVGRRWPFVHGAGFFVGFALWRFDMAFAFISLIGLGGFIIALGVVSVFRRRRSRARPAVKRFSTTEASS